MKLIMLQAASPRPFRKADDSDREEVQEPLSKSRKESAHSSPSKSVATAVEPFNDLQRTAEQRRANGTKEKNDEIQSTLDSLLAEVDREIRFTVCLDEELKEEEELAAAAAAAARGDENSCDRNNDDVDNGGGINDADDVPDDLSAMKRSIDVLRSQLSSSKATLGRDPS